MSESRQNLLYTNTNPNPDTICDACRPWIGHVFRPENAPPVPVHPHCYCTLYPTFDKPTKAPKIKDLTDKAQDLWMRRVAWMLRHGIVIPPLLAPLIAAAERYNEEREEKEKESEDQLMALMINEPTMTRAQLSGHIELDPFDVEDQIYQCLFIGAGRVCFCV